MAIQVPIPAGELADKRSVQTKPLLAEEAFIMALSHKEAIADGTAEKALFVHIGISY